MCLASTMLIMLLEHEDFSRRDLSSLRSLALGGMLIPPELVRRAEAALGIPIEIIFGMTELCGIARQDDLADDRAFSIRHPLPHAELNIVDPHPDQIGPPG